MGNLYYESLENGSNKNNFTNHVVMSLKDYEDMKAAIKDLKESNEHLRSKVNNYMDIFRRCQLPADIIADGKVKNIDRFENVDAITRERTYIVKLTVAEEDVRGIGYE